MSASVRQWWSKSFSFSRAPWLTENLSPFRAVTDEGRVDEGVGEREQRGGEEVLHCMVSTFYAIQSHLALRRIEVDLLATLLSTLQEDRWKRGSTRPWSELLSLSGPLIRSWNCCRLYYTSSMQTLHTLHPPPHTHIYIWIKEGWGTAWSFNQAELMQTLE